MLDYIRMALLPNNKIPKKEAKEKLAMYEFENPMKNAPAWRPWHGAKNNNRVQSFERGDNTYPYHQKQMPSIYGKNEKMEEDLGVRSYIVDCDKFRTRVERSVSPFAFKKYLEDLDLNDEMAPFSEELDRYGENFEPMRLYSAGEQSSQNQRASSPAGSKLKFDLKIDTSKNTNKQFSQFQNALPESQNLPNKPIEIIQKILKSRAANTTGMTQ